TAAGNIVEALTAQITAANRNIAEADSLTIFSPKTITVNNPDGAAISPTLPASVAAGKTITFSLTYPQDKTVTVEANGVEIFADGTGLYAVVAMQNSVINITLKNIEVYTPVKATVDNIDWKTFLAQHDMYWTSISSSPDTGADNSVNTGYYAGAIMGNGLIGTNLYKLEANTYRLNAGRSDVTEARTPYNLFNSARLPIGYFTLKTAGTVSGEKMRLSLYDAITNGTFTTDKGLIKFKTYVHAQKDYIVFETDATGDEANYTWNFVAQKAISPRVLAVTTSGRPDNYSSTKPNPDVITRTEGDYHLSIQPLATDDSHATIARVYVVAWKEVKDGNKRRIIATISQEPTEQAAIDAAKAVIDEGFAATSTALEDSHKAWWNNFYKNAAFLTFPNTRFESFYWAQYYKFASTTRPGKPLVDLQGVWPSAHTPWTAIWVNLNLQLTYSWQTKANLGMLSESLWDALNNNSVNLHRNTSLMAARYGGANANGYWDDAAVLPRTATYDLYAPLNPDNDATNQYEVGNLSWTLFYYWQHCVGYGDTDALKTKLFPLLRDAINSFFHIRTGPDANGKYGIPATASPEYTTGSAGANTNYDLANLRWGLMTLIDIDTTYHINDPRLADWKDFLENLVDFQTDANGYKISSTIGIPSSGTTHRHYSHLFMLYPYHMVSWDNPTENALLTTSLSKWNGNQGYSYTGKAAMLATKGDGDGALSQMTTFMNTYIKPNTLYAETGPVIETPLAAVSTLHEFYMQDWGDRIRIFFGVPSSWANASFVNMRAKGAFLVSATRKNAQTTFIQVESEKGGLCRLQTGIAGSNIQVIALDGSPVPFTVTDANTGTIEVNTALGDVFQVIDKSVSPVLPEPLEHPLGETMYYGVNNGPDVPLTSMSFENSAETLTETSPSKFLSVTGEPSYASLGSLTWTSSNPAAVRVQNGLIQALGAGVSVIEASNADGISAQCTVTVQDDSFSSYTSIPEADTYAYDGGGGTGNFGAAEVVTVKLDGSGYNRMGFFKFSTADINTYTAKGDSAKIEVSLYINRTNTTSNTVNRRFYAVSDTGWSETGLTWNNKPAVSTTLLGDVPGTLVSSSDYNAANRLSFDITNYVWQQYAAGKTLIAFNATQASDVGSTHDFDFASKENSDPRKLPYIVVRQETRAGSGLPQYSAQGTTVYPSVTDGIVFVSAASASDYFLSDVQGRKLLAGKIFAQECNVVDLTAFSRGIYLLMVGNKAYKLMRR
ncbi:MAG: DNRLRE domain-containing protein, partial [Prevotella sp.]|nr:DNRLRE domain-containing protein [Prevotella sp.]